MIVKFSIVLYIINRIQYISISIIFILSGKNDSISHSIHHNRHFYRYLTSKKYCIKSAGIGGGPILNICLMLGFGYEAHDSMYITYLFLIGGASASIWKNKDKKNPKTGTPLMDYNLIMITLPMSVTGSLFGVIIDLLRLSSIILYPN